jgi:hypothetical protein
MSVRKLLSRRGLSDGGKDEGRLGKDDWWVSDLARERGVPGGRLRDWAALGRLRARRVSAHGPWIIWADGRERDRVRELLAHSGRGRVGDPTSKIASSEKQKEAIIH